jgi:hypothetical protein
MKGREVPTVTKQPEVRKWSNEQHPRCEPAPRQQLEGECLRLGRIVFRPNPGCSGTREPCEGFFIVQRGVIRIYRENAAGKAQTIHVFHLVDSFAEAVLASGESYPASALAASAVILVPKT